MNAAEIEELLIKLVQIPAPTGREQKRAEYITDWLKELGYHPFTDAGRQCHCGNEGAEGGYTVLMAHMDTVFEDVDISVVKNANILSAPGIGDDTCNAAFLMAVMKTLIGQKCRPLKNLLFVFDTGEEGLGNCRGTRQLMQDYKDKVDEVISFDLGSDAVCVKAVGSKRYRVTVTAPGGHSFHAFGQKGAIETAAEIIHEIYRIKPCEGTQTTYNVGMIEGGTSVNTIAQKCTFLAEVRSDDAQALQKIDGQLCNIFDFFNNAEGFAKVQISYELTGFRPTGNGVPEAAQKALADTAAEVICRYTGREPVRRSGSTDCNIPLSMGIPAVSFGGYRGGGAHTRQEWVDAGSFEEGYNIILAFIGKYFIWKD